MPTMEVAGKRNDIDIANVFADHPDNATSHRSYDNTAYRPDIRLNLDSLAKWRFNIEDVDNVIYSLKCGKAAGWDGVKVVRYQYWLPFKNLSNLVMLHGYVPDDFSSSLIVPIIKNRLGHVSSPEIYKAIIIGNIIIAKTFELCL